MEINIEHGKSVITFADIECGNIFKYNDEYFIKGYKLIKPVECNYGAINVDNGSIVHFMSDEVVEKVDAILTIKEN